MAIQLFELCGADPARRFSPYCWRSRLALAHKGLAVETISWRFTEKDAIGAHGAQKVPVMLDNGRTIIDSWVIAEYLEDTYPDRPSLFGGTGGHALARFINAWGDAVLHAGIARLVVSDIVQHLAPEDAAYFVPDREKRFGMKLEAVTADRAERVKGFRDSLMPLRIALRSAPFLHGDTPGYADMIVFGGFQWARCVSAFPLLTQDDAVYAWRERMLDAYGGIARAAPGYAEA
jgi:glutathione S-transferase